jgi:hypothetical protein
MSKREVFIVADDGWQLKSEKELRDFLDTAEKLLLKDHPGIDNTLIQGIIRAGGTERDRLALMVLERLRILRDTLNEPDTPAWQAAALGIRFQDLAMIYRQPITASAKGRAHRKGAAGRKAKDEPVMRVFRNLRDLSPAEALEAMRVRQKISDVYVYSTGTGKKRRWFFESRDRQGKILSSVDYAESTLKSKKFRKAKQRVIEG